MEKPNIKKLKYPLWFNIVFYVLTVILPISLIMVKGYKSESQTFRITFGVISSIVIVWTFLYRFIFVNYKKKFTENKIKYEHEYEVEIGNPKKVKYLWFLNEQYLSVLNVCTIIFYGLLFFVILDGLNKGILEIQGILYMIATSYLLAYVLRFLYIALEKSKSEEGEEKEKENESISNNK